MEEKKKITGISQYKLSLTRRGDSHGYVTQEEGDIPKNLTRTGIINYAKEIIKDKKYPKSVSLELTINQN